MSADSKIRDLVRAAAAAPDDEGALAAAKRAVLRVTDFAKEELALLLFQLGTSEAVEIVLREALTGLEGEKSHGLREEIVEDTQRLAFRLSAYGSSGLGSSGLGALRNLPIGDPRPRSLRRNFRRHWYHQRLMPAGMRNVSFFHEVGAGVVTNIEQPGMIPVRASCLLHAVSLTIKAEGLTSLEAIQWFHDVVVDVVTYGGDRYCLQGPDAILNTGVAVFDVGGFVPLGVGQSFMIIMRHLEEKSIFPRDVTALCKLTTTHDEAIS